MIRYRGCVSLARSLEIMHMRDFPGAYGVGIQEYDCELCWSKVQRDGWMSELWNAQVDIERELGDNYVCPREVCSEVHRTGLEIQLKHPILSLGNYLYTDWQTLDIAYSETPFEIGTKGTIVICNELLEIGGTTYSIDDIEWDYPEEIAECLTGLQEVQAPCYAGETDPDEVCLTGGHEFWWPIYQLASPLNMATPSTECTDLTDADQFLTQLRFRFRYIDDTGAVTLVGQCSCGNSCDVSGVTAEIKDAAEGIICLSGNVCGTNSRVKINYISAYRCADSPDPVLEKAIVVLAIVYAGPTIAKPCECDNTWIDKWAEPDPLAPHDLPSRMRYGASNGGMFVMRTINRYLYADNQTKTTAIPLAQQVNKRNYLQRFF